MTVQCWKSSITPPLSTRLRNIIVIVDRRGYPGIIKAINGNSRHFVDLILPKMPKSGQPKNTVSSVVGLSKNAFSKYRSDRSTKLSRFLPSAPNIASKFVWCSKSKCCFVVVLVALLSFKSIEPRSVLLGRLKTYFLK